MACTRCPGGCTRTCLVPLVQEVLHEGVDAVAEAVTAETATYNAEQGPPPGHPEHPASTD